MDTTSGDDSEGEENYNHGDLYKSMLVDIDDSSEESMYRQLTFLILHGIPLHILNVFAGFAVFS